MTEPNLSPGERMSALFANMVIQQTNMALMMLGKIAHPETGQPIKDLDAAKLFIDQLEMIEHKTRGNLNKDEEGLLKQSLTALRMSFVEAVETKGAPGGDTRPQEISQAAPGGQAQQPQAAPAEAEESRKRFTKKY